MIYHYIDFNALYGSITKGEVWMFSTSGMNVSEVMVN